MNNKSELNKKISTNEREMLLRRIAKDTVISFKLEGIFITIDEAYKMALDIDANLQKRN